MRIVIDIQACQSSSKFGGIGRYVQNLITAMINESHQHEIIFVLNDQFLDSISNIYSILANVNRNNIRIFKLPAPLNYNDEQNLSRNAVAEILYEHFIFSLKPDIFYIASLVEGLGDNVITSVGRLGYADITAATMYDLIPLVQKEIYLQDSIAKKHYMRKMDDFKKASLLLAISQFSKEQAIELLNMDSNKIVNISSAIDEKFQPIKYEENYLQTVFQKYNITKKYFLYTASFDQRKNHHRLIEAFSLLPSEVREEFQVVIVGNGWDSIYEHFKSLAKGFGLTKDDIVFAGYMPDDELLAIYNNAFAFVFVSLSEGFGLPALEAMSCGVATIGSNTTSIPEVVGCSEALFNPYDVKSISSKMLRLVQDSDFRDSLVSHALKYSKKFSWSASAKKTIEAFEDIYARTKNVQDFSNIYNKTVKALCELKLQNPLNETELSQIASAIEANEKASKHYRVNKIGWITTFNTRCGIAMYSKYLMGAHRDEYTIFAPRDTNLVAQDDKNIYRLFDVGVDELRELYNKIVELEITTLVIQFNYGFFDFNYFDIFIREVTSLGVRVFITLHSTTDTIEKELCEIKNALLCAQKVIVHSDKDIKVLKSLGIYKNVELFAQGIIDLQPSNKTDFMPKKGFTLATYGFMLPHKGFLETLEAFHMLLKKEPDVHLLMINALYPADISKKLLESIEQKISSYGIEKNVMIISDFLDDEQSIAYLKSADLVLYPYQETGESSSAALRMAIASEVSIMATPLPIFDDVKEFVNFTGGTSSKEIFASLENFLYNLRNNNHEIEQNIQKSKEYKNKYAYSKLSKLLYKMLKV
ncbi:MAG: glycosyltransferase [Sulfurimonas sp.]|uniref:glycosyltransferase n=1 Tax=Sulfurimonas sp. TaxID=2022749 RepID=UPI003D10CC1E